MSVHSNIYYREIRNGYRKTEAQRVSSSLHDLQVIDALIELAHVHFTLDNCNDSADTIERAKDAVLGFDRALDGIESDAMRQKLAMAAGESRKRIADLEMQIIHRRGDNWQRPCSNYRTQSQN